jgi:hypothetical protein
VSCHAVLYYERSYESNTIHMSKEREEKRREEKGGD